MLAATQLLTMSWWVNSLTILIGAGTIFFFLKRVIVKSISSDLKDINYKMSPNGKNTQNIGDIAARSEEAIRELKDILGVIRVENMQTKEILIEHIGWHKGQSDQI
jgi:hypothetical protein